MVNGPEDAAVFYEEPTDAPVDPVPAETDPEPAPADDPAPANQPEPSSGSNTGLFGGGAAVAVGAVGGIALAVSKKKKK